jgi:hypothetical protein
MAKKTTNLNLAKQSAKSAAKPKLCAVAKKHAAKPIRKAAK